MSISIFNGKIQDSLFTAGKITCLVAISLLTGAWDNYSSPMCEIPRDFPGLERSFVATTPDTGAHISVTRVAQGTYEVHFNQVSDGKHSIIEYDLTDFKTCQTANGFWIMEQTKAKPFWSFWDRTYSSFPTEIFMARAIEWSPVAKRNGYPYQSLNTRQLSFDAQKLQTMEASYQLREMEPLSGVIQKLVTNHDLPKPDEASKAFIPWIASSWMPLFIKANSSL